MSANPNLWRRLLGAVRRANDTGAVEQAQREALLDLLVWAMYADRHLALPERKAIRQHAEDMDWDSPTDPATYLDEAVVRLRELLGDDAAEATHLRSISVRLGTPDMRLLSYRACQELTAADGERRPEEEAFLARVANQFGIAAGER